MRTRCINGMAGLDILLVVCALCVPQPCVEAARGNDTTPQYYAGEQIYLLRPHPDRKTMFGHIGPTGIQTCIYPGVELKVEATEPGTPAHGLFKKGDIIRGVNDMPHKGTNVFVFMGTAITQAEATDGKLVFDVISDGTPKSVTVTIPVRGTYSKTWPVNCAKSKTIIDAAAQYYSSTEFGNSKASPIDRAMACLFLLSTGDDSFLPNVREHVLRFPKGDHSWYNGYCGIAACEYYLRTGDKAAGQVIQYYCDNAKLRQKFDSAWNHWGLSINPAYNSGIMNAASIPILTSLLLANECGADVDQKTLLNAFKYFFRFVGHGSVPYGDHRDWCGLVSNGRDSMLAAAMQVACAAEGDTAIYQMARDHLSMQTITNYPGLIIGHGDQGRGDGLWRGMAASYLREAKPQEYQEIMDRIQWWYDLCRHANGGLGIATNTQRGYYASPHGAGVALGYTAPLKTLRITGAPRSKYAKNVTLPEHLWGTKADSDFYRIDHNPAYFKYGKDEPTHIPFYLLGSPYRTAAKEPKEMSRSEIMKNIYHRRYMIRARGAKALRKAEYLEDLEKLLSDKDARVRRAALDGIISDDNDRFSKKPYPLKPEQYTAGMIETIVGMLKDPEEAWYVVDGALWAVKNMPATTIQQNVDAIMPWTKHEEWWLRESSFAALSGLDKDEELYERILPTLVEMVINEYRAVPRGTMLRHLAGKVDQKHLTSPAARIIMAGSTKAAQVAEVKEGPRSAEGAYNVMTSVRFCLENDPSTALSMAHVIKEHFDVLDVGQISSFISSPSSPEAGRRKPTPCGLYTLIDQQSDKDRRQLIEVLYDDFRAEVQKRTKPLMHPEYTFEEGIELDKLLSVIVDLTKLKQDIAGWQPTGVPTPAERTWKYHSVDSPEKIPTRFGSDAENNRWARTVPPRGMEQWYMPAFDDTAWKSGKAPIGRGDFKPYARGHRGVPVIVGNSSDWGDGEYVMARTTFELEDLDCDYYRLRVLSNKQYNIYLNGHLIHTHVWYREYPHYRRIMLTHSEIKHLKMGTNMLAAIANASSRAKKPGSTDYRTFGQLDVYVEGLKIKELGL